MQRALCRPWENNVVDGDHRDIYLGTRALIDDHLDASKVVWVFIY